MSYSKREKKEAMLDQNREIKRLRLDVVFVEVKGYEK